MLLRRLWRVLFGPQPEPHEMTLTDVVDRAIRNGVLDALLTDEVIGAYVLSEVLKRSDAVQCPTCEKFFVGGRHVHRYDFLLRELVLPEREQLGLGPQRQLGVIPVIDQDETTVTFAP